MKALVAILVALALVAVACGGGDVSQAEYDQKLADLALAQQELLEARQEVAASAVSREALNDLAARYESVVLEALGLRAMTVPEGFDRAEVLGEAVAATVRERDELLAGVEGASPHPEGGVVDTDRLGGFLTIAGSVLLFVSPDRLPDDATVRESLGPLVEQVDDEMITLAYEELLAAYSQGAADERRAELLNTVGYWAIEMALSALAR